MSTTPSYKYPFKELTRQLRLVEPSPEHIYRAQWERDVRAVAEAIVASEVAKFDPEFFCHCLGIQYDVRAATKRPRVLG